MSSDVLTGIGNGVFCRALIRNTGKQFCHHVYQGGSDLLVRSNVDAQEGTARSVSFTALFQLCSAEDGETASSE